VEGDRLWELMVGEEKSLTCFFRLRECREVARCLGLELRVSVVILSRGFFGRHVDCGVRVLLVPLGGRLPMMGSGHRADISMSASLYQFLQLRHPPRLIIAP
jgi:hypothetical protein